MIIETTTNTNVSGIVEVKLEIWYVKTYTKNENGWTLFHYGSKAPEIGTAKNLVALCGNTMLMKQKEENGYYGFKVIGGNIQARTSQTNEIIYFNTKKTDNIKMVWLSKSNIQNYLTKEKPKYFNEKALVVIEQEKRTFDLRIENQVFAILKYNEEKILITLNTPRNSQFDIIPNGRYKILSPDYSHAVLFDDNGNSLGALASQYLSTYPNMRNYDVWFPIKFKDLKTAKQDRYIHPGRISHGCVSIYDMNKWNNLFDYLISHRDSEDNQYIGELEVRL